MTVSHAIPQDSAASGQCSEGNSVYGQSSNSLEAEAAPVSGRLSSRESRCTLDCASSSRRRTSDWAFNPGPRGPGEAARWAAREAQIGLRTVMRSITASACVRGRACH